MAPPVIVVETGLDLGFLKHLKKLQVCEAGRKIRIFESLASALPAIQEADFQADGLLFMGPEVELPRDIMDTDRVIRICEGEESAPPNSGRRISPETEDVIATILEFTDILSEL